MTADWLSRRAFRASPERCAAHKARIAAVTRRRAYRTQFVAALALVLSLLTPVAAQRQVNPANRDRRLQVDAARSAPNSPPILIETSPSLANLLSRAEEGIARRDWKFAIDSLQRVIDNTRGSLVPRSDGAVEGGVLFEAARRTATKRLATLPPDGLRAYRMLYDGKAYGLFERARAEHDPAVLRLIAQRYLLTRYGDDAAELLASWSLDEGRAGEAFAFLRDVLELVPDADIPEDRLAAKIAAAYALLGRSAQAATTIADYRNTLGDGEDPPSWHAEVAGLAPAPLGSESGIADSSGAFVDNLVGTGWNAPTIMPSLLESTPWRHELPGSVAGLWRHIFDDDPSDPPVIDVTELASDGRRLFVRKPGGCAALEMDDLSTVWESTHDAIAGAAGLRRESTAQGLSQVFTGGRGESIEDDALAMITSAAGLVLVVESEGEGEFANRDEVAPPLLLPGLLRPRMAPATPDATKLVAYDTATGEIRWQRGRTGDPADLLGNVRFCSTPISVGETLWAPHLDNKDFYVAVLRSEDGSLINNVLLGSVLQPTPLRRYATPPSYADGVVYVPSGYGVLFAVDAVDFLIRWAIQYRGGDGGNGTSASDGAFPWIPSPPVVAGGSVVLAATDHEELLAFSAASGEFRWSVPSRDTSYVIAADQSRIWLGGRSVSCLSVVDGELLWKTQVAAFPTGRGVRSGDVIHVSTSEGLMSLDASDGSHIGTQALPSPQTPLGNLLCAGSAVFSLDPASVRKYPDLGRMRASASAAYRADPTDVRAAVRLAWAELLSGDPHRAYQIVERVSDLFGEGDGERLPGVHHVRLEALLALAREDDTDPARALEFLQAANDSAATPRERLRCGRLIADHQWAMGDPVEAYRTLLELGLTPEADLIVSSEESVEVSARLEIAERLRLLRRELAPQRVDEIDKEVNARIAGAARHLGDMQGVGEAAALLRAAAELQGNGSMAASALLALANWELSRQRYERSEWHLFDGIRRGGDSPATIPARKRLCELYGESWENVTALLVPCLDDLDARFGPQRLPDDPVDQVGRGAGGLVSDWVVGVRSRIPSAQLDLYERRLPESYLPGPNEALGLTGERVWSYSFGAEDGPLRFVSLTTSSDAELNDRIILSGSGKTLECLDAATGTLQWRTRLQLPGTFTGEVARRRGSPETAWPQVVVDGQVAVFNDAEGLFAVGLVTGRRLWARPFEAPSAGDTASRRDTAIAVGEGLLAAMPRDGFLTLLRLLDGSTVWERDLRGEPVASIWMRDDCVVTADAPMQRVHVFDRLDGRLIGQVPFRQPDPHHGLVHLIWTGDVLCGPDSTTGSDAVQAVNMKEGASAWRIEVDKPLVQLFEVEEGYLGVSLLGGDVWVIEAFTGEVVLVQQVATVDKVTDGLLVDGMIIVRTESGQGQRIVADLTAFDVATGEEIWEREDLAPLSGSLGPLKAVSGVIPAIVVSRGSQIRPGGVAVRTGKAAVAMIDIHTGLNVGSVIDLASADPGGQMNGDMMLGPGTLVVGTGKAIQAFETARAQAEPEKDF